MFATLWWEVQATWVYFYVSGVLELKLKPAEINRRIPIYFIGCGISYMENVLHIF